MKRTFIYITAAFALVACGKDSATDILSPDDGSNGILRMSISAPAAESFDKCRVAIFKLSATDGERGLIRRYDSAAEAASPMWLAAGDYEAEVEIGEAVTASFDKKHYTGGGKFSITAGASTETQVKCSLRNVLATVAFDSSVGDKFDKGFHALIGTDASFADETTYLRYDDNGATGYYTLPADASSLYWHFEGEGSDAGSVVKHGEITGVKPSMKYTLRLAYSKDLGGTFDFTFSVEESAEIHEDVVVFTPAPKITGSDFDLTQTQNYATGDKAFDITSSSAISTVEVEYAGTTYSLPADAAAGITASGIGTKSVHLVLTEEFLSMLSSGESTVAIRATDDSNGRALRNVVFACRGVENVVPIDLWDGTARVEGFLAGASSGDIAVEKREAGGEWKSYPATADAAGNVTATVSDYIVNRTYEYRITSGGKAVAGRLAAASPEGAQMPNSDMEYWHKEGNTWFPSAAGDSGFWDSGNPGATKIGGDKFNTTLSSDDVRPGSKGTKSAYCHSNFPNLAGIGKFAAGSLATAHFAGTAGTDGQIDFGREFEFKGRPRALRFWYKNYVGAIDQRGKYPDVAAGDPDLLKMFFCLANWTAPHRVDTRDTSTCFEPETAEGIVAYSVVRSFESHAEWTCIELELEYVSDVRPNYILAVFTPSGYGDYFTGSTDSWLYLDDFEILY